MLKRFLIKTRFPLFLLLLCFSAFGLLIPFLGFYWDDWPMIWFAQSQGPLGFPAAFSGDRPFLSGIYVLTTSVLGIAPVEWQILGLISRWLVVLSGWWTIKQIWPEHEEEASWAAILLAIFPGFKQQPISVVYSNGLFLLTAYYLSYGLMVRSIRTNRIKWIHTISALITYSICLLSTEYYIGLDVIRGAIIWLLLTGAKDRWTRAKQTFLTWLPYLGILLVFLIWRVFIFQFPTYQPELVETVTSSPQGTLVNLIFRMFQDPIKAGWEAWAQTIRIPELGDFSTNTMRIFWIIVSLSFAAMVFYLYKINPRLLQQHNSGKEGEKSTNSILAIGLLGLFFSGWPYWITNLPIELQYPYDRFMLAFMLCSVLFLIGLLNWVIKKYYQKILLLSLIISMALGSHFLNANSYRRDWLTHNDIFWQLSWRVPALQPGTTLLTYTLPTTYYSDNSLTAPLNLIYDFDNHSLDLSYLFAFADVRVGRSIPVLEPGYSIEQGFRNATFNGNTSNIVVFFYASPGCLRILDPEKDAGLPIYPIEYNEAISLSNVSLISESSNIGNSYMPEEIFGQEPAHTWCYYYQKSDLARQNENWETIIALRAEAETNGYYPVEPSENLIYIEAFAQSGDWEKAAELALQTFNSDSRLQDNICDTITGIDSKVLEDRELYDSLMDDLDCLFP